MGGRHSSSEVKDRMAVLIKKFDTSFIQSGGLGSHYVYIPLFCAMRGIRTLSTSGDISRTTPIFQELAEMSLLEYAYDYSFS